jgi:microsomal epoxide hydrolase
VSIACAVGRGEHATDGQNLGINAKYFEGADSEWISKPLGYSLFPKEIAPTPVHWVEKISNLVWSREHSGGGHFAALEKPNELWGDVEDFVQEHWGKTLLKQEPQ